MEYILYNENFQQVTVLAFEKEVPYLWSMLATSATRIGDYEEPITPYEGLKFQTSLAQGLRSAGDFPLLRARDVVMPDGTRLEDFKPTGLPSVDNTNNGKVLMVKDGKWDLGETIRAEVDSQTPTILNIF